MKIGIVSDTHGQTDTTLAAVGLLTQCDVAAVLHCGDIGSRAVVPLFGDWPTHFVFGNVDYDHDALEQAINEAGQTCHGRFGSLELGGRKIAWLHSDDQDLFSQTIGGGAWDLVCYGHTHCAEQHFVGKTLVLNPGALQRANRYTIAIVDLERMTAEHHVI